jgi:hypothetical protein
MAIFNSKSLDRSVFTEELLGLDPSDLDKLRNELFDCIEGINTSLAEVSVFEEKHGLAPDEEWRHRAKKKLRICTQFAAKIEALDKGSPLSYKEAYQKHFLEILTEELDPLTLKKIQDEAAELARTDVSRD